MMLYLLYLRNGFIKKFPLDRKKILLGRSKKCDFFIDETFVSKEHARLTTYPDYIEIEDLGSTNGVFTERGGIRTERIHLNQWFRIGYLKFFLKEGNAEAFVLSDKVQPLFNRMSNVIASPEKTTEALNILYTEPLVEMLQIGFSIEKYGNLFKDADKILKPTLKKGCLLLTSKKERVFKIESHWNYKKKYADDFNLIAKSRDFLQKTVKNLKTDASHYYASFPVQVKPGDPPMVLLYLCPTSISNEICDFLGLLALEISVIHTLLEQDQPAREEPRDETKAPEIITVNPKMLNCCPSAGKLPPANCSS
jgi:hypothetical protein